MSLVSVIVAIYNVECYLEKCLESIVNQSYTKLEIILVDDGSTDRSGTICEKYAKKDSRIKIIHKTNAGLGMARNSGLAVASGKYTIFVDSDDWLDLKMIEKMVYAIESTSSDFCVCGFIKQTDLEQIVSENSCCNVQMVFDCEEIQEKVLFPILGADLSKKNDIEREMCVWTNMYATSIITKYSLSFVSEREYLSEDLFYNINYIMNINRAVFIPECLYHYRFNKSSLTNIYRANRYKLLCNLYEKEIEILKSYNLYDKAFQRVNRTFIMKSRNVIRILVNSKNESFRTRYCDLKKILNDETLQKVLAEYPIEKYNISLRVPAFCMKYHLTACLWIEQKFRAYLKRRR